MLCDFQLQVTESPDSTSSNSEGVMSPNKKPGGREWCWLDLLSSEALAAAAQAFPLVRTAESTPRPGGAHCLGEHPEAGDDLPPGPLSQEHPSGTSPSPHTSKWVHPSLNPFSGAPLSDFPLRLTLQNGVHLSLNPSWASVVGLPQAWEGAPCLAQALSLRWVGEEGGRAG